MRREDQPAIACTLQGDNYRDRLAWIAQLAHEGLLSHERRDLVLELRYRRSVADRVRDMVTKERECCAFLEFDTEETIDEIRVRISVPERARAAVDLIFEEFIPAAATTNRTQTHETGEACCGTAATCCG